MTDVWNMRFFSFFPYTYSSLVFPEPKYILSHPRGLSPIQSYLKFSLSSVPNQIHKFPSPFFPWDFLQPLVCCQLSQSSTVASVLSGHRYTRRESSFEVWCRLVQLLIAWLVHLEISSVWLQQSQRWAHWCDLLGDSRAPTYASCPCCLLV